MNPLIDWTRRTLDGARRSPTGYFMILLAVVVGLVTGAVATLYRYALILSHRLFFAQAHVGPGGSVVNSIIAAGLPILGGLLLGFVLYRVLRSTGGHGVPSLMKAVVTGNINLPPSMAAKSALSVVTMACGASAGPEGPIVEIGAVAGATVGRFGQVARRRMGTLVGCGAASGIAAIFNAPLGGVLFALELILREFTIPRFTPVVLSAVIAAVTAKILIPHEPAFEVSRELMGGINTNFAMIFAFALLGTLCAVFSSMFIASIYHMQDLFQRNVRLKTWLKPAVGGLIVGSLALLLPGVRSEGYPFLNETILRPDKLPVNMAIVLFLYALAKIVATAVTLGSGFVGGSFAPAMFIGATLGASFGIIAKLWFPESAPEPAVFALVGMAGVVAGSLNAPFSACIIIYEITGGSYQILLPLLITVAASAWLTRRLQHGSVYTLSLLRDGFDVDAATQQHDPLAGLLARDTMTTDLPTIPARATLGEILEQVAATDAPAFCVVDEHGRFCGMISVQDLRAVLTLGEDMGPLLLAHEIADPHPDCLAPRSPLSEALAIFGRSSHEAIPVLDPANRDHVVGVVLRRKLFELYNEKQSSEESRGGKP